MEAVRLAGLVGGALLVPETLGKRRYEEVKGSDVLEGRQQVKEDMRTALKGWVRNTGDDSWHLEEQS